MKKARKLILLVPLSFLAISLGQTRSLEAHNAREAFFSEEDGLPGSQVRALTQDGRGRLWVLTRAGLSMFDGGEIRVVPSPAGLSPLEIGYLTNDASGNIWITSRTTPVQVAWFDGTSWHHLPQPVAPGSVDTIINKLVVTRNGEAVVSTLGEGLYSWHEGSWTRVRPEDLGSSGTIHDLAAVKNRVYVAAEAGLCILRNRALDCGQPWSDPHLHSPIQALYHEPPQPPGKPGAGRLWLLGRDWLGSLHLDDGWLEMGHTGLKYPMHQSSPQSDLYAHGTIGVDLDGNVYFGNFTHGFEWEAGSDSFAPLGNLVHDAPQGITAFLVDRESNTWLGSTGGLLRLGRKVFEIYDQADGLLSNEVTAMLETSPGKWIFGHRWGLSFFDGKVERVVSFGDSSTLIGRSVKVVQLAQGPGGEVYFTTISLGAGKLKPDGTLTWLKSTGEKTPMLCAVAVDRNGVVWLGGDGLYQLQGKRLVEVSPGSELPLIRSLQAIGGQLFASTSHGLYIRDLGPDGTWRHACVEEPESANEVYSVFVERSGTVLVGTLAGLFELEGSTLRPARISDQAVRRPVFTIATDWVGRRWLGTDNGLLVSVDGELHRVSAEHGLAGREVHPGALVVDHRGKVWVGTEGGVSEQIAPIDDLWTPPPTAEIRHLHVSGKVVSTDQPVELRHTENFLEFEISGVYLSGRRLLRRHRLEGYDPTWVGPFSLSPFRIRYPALPPGRYRLHLKVGPDGGPWSDEATSAWISILPPLWQRPWFLGLVTIVALGLATGGAQLHRRLAFAASHDLVTGLANRAELSRRIQEAMDRWLNQTGEQAGYALLMIDLDRFKPVNESLGQALGDELLAAFGHRLQGCVAPADCVARVGEDEFCVLLETLYQPEDAQLVAERILSSLNRPFVLQGQEIYLSAAVGICPGDLRYETPAEPVRSAEVALRQAKRRGRGPVEVFVPALHERALELIRLEADLRRALQQRELRILFQPIIRLRSGRVAACEALLRWSHPVQGLLSPARFLHVAEETGLIQPIGDWVLLEAARQIGVWRQLGLIPESSFSVAVNLSPKQLGDLALPDRLAEVLEQTGIAGSDLTLEITERSLETRAKKVSWLLHRCRKLGVSISIDDFGVGHSSLSYLQRFPAHRLKIDRSFVTPLRRQGADWEIIRTILRLGSSLGMEVVAEGVETEDQAEILRDLGCAFAQGFYFAKPLTGDELGARFKEEWRPLVDGAREPP